MDPMEDFLSREKAALQALELAGDDAMQIDDPPTPVIVKPASPSPRSSASLDTFTPFVASTSSNSNAVAAHAGPVAAAPSSATPSASSPMSPHSRAARPETATMREWRTERAQRIAQADAQAEQARQSRREEARRELERFRSQWAESLEERRRTNRAKSATTGGGLGDWDREESTMAGVGLRDSFDWEQLRALIDVLPKPAKDCSRLLAILKSV